MVDACKTGKESLATIPFVSLSLLLSIRLKVYSSMYVIEIPLKDRIKKSLFLPYLSCKSPFVSVSSTRQLFLFN